RHRGVLIVRIARVVPGVVQKEERALLDRAADGGAEPLLQVLRLGGGLSVQRVRRGVERGGVETLEDRSADLLRAASAATERAAEARAAAEAAASAEPAAPARLTRGVGSAAGTDAVGTEHSEPLCKLARPVRTEKQIVLLRRAGGGHRFG